MHARMPSMRMRSETHWRAPRAFSLSLLPCFSLVATFIERLLYVTPSANGGDWSLALSALVSAKICHGWVPMLTAPVALDGSHPPVSLCSQVHPMVTHGDGTSS